MAAAESRARHRLGLLGVSLMLLAIGVLVAYDIGLSRRVAALEAAVDARDKVDPLVPFECNYRGVVRGASRDMPCFVTFRRLLQAPQQFDGRWVQVQGRYEHAFEVSALFAPDAAPANDADPYGQALWISGALQPRQAGESLDRAVGVFHRGPTGHLGAYFGLVGAR